MAIQSGTTLLIRTDVSGGGGNVQIEDITDVQITLGKTVIDTTTKDSAYWRALLVGTRNATITGTAYVDVASTEGFTEMLGYFNSNTVNTWEIDTGTTGDDKLSGNGYVTGIDYGGTLDGVTTYNFTIEVTGAVTIGTV